jgi:diguanylate cyclase (GGDEF)-like protein/PAS domain S-box-containing protein
MIEDHILSLPFRPFFTTFITAVALVNIQGKILVANPAFMRLVGQPARKVNGHPFLNFIPAEKNQEVREMFDAFLQDSLQRYEFDTLLSDVNGQKLPTRLGLSLVHDTSDKPLCLLLTFSESAIGDEAGKSSSWRDLASGLYNRMVFQEQLDHAIKRARREDEKLGILVMGLDRFKQLQDSFGQEVGEQLLGEAGIRIAEFVRKSDCVVLFGSDQCAILLEGIKQAEHISVVAQKLRNAFLSPFKSNNEEVFMSVSIGISVFPLDGTDAERLIKNAESAMHQVIKEGGDSFLFYTPALHSRAMERIQMENDLRRALKNEEFVIYYQPMLNADGDKITCLEALVRWNHPQKGLISPMTFIPLLEETGLIVPVGEWVLRAACQYLSQLRSNGHGHLRVAVNISARQIAQQHFINTLNTILQETQVDPEALELEITESVLIKNIEENWETLRGIAACGVRIALDDFGTGCSSLSYLKHFPIHTLKIDRNFVKGLPDQRGDLAITNAILVLAMSMGLRVIAEGVETETQLDYLRQRDCHEMQGFFFARPMPMTEVGDWLRSRLH